MYLLDTNVISELRRNKPHGAVLSWIQNVSVYDLFISAVTIGEIQVGIERTRTQDGDKARALEHWLEKILATWNVIPMDAVAFRVWAQITRKTSQTVHHDAMIAATAKVHRLTIVTRNVNDFVHFNVPIFNPF